MSAVKIVISGFLSVNALNILSRLCISVTNKAHRYNSNGLFLISYHSEHDPHNLLFLFLHFAQFFLLFPGFIDLLHTGHLNCRILHSQMCVNVIGVLFCMIVSFSGLIFCLESPIRLVNFSFRMPFLLRISSIRFSINQQPFFVKQYVSSCSRSLF